MTHSTGDDLDRTTERSVRPQPGPVLSGGALVHALVGASAAHRPTTCPMRAPSRTAPGAAHSGDATAVGNQSGTNTTQTVTVSGNLGTIQVINQQANVVNGGVGISEHRRQHRHRQLPRTTPPPAPRRATAASAPCPTRAPRANGSNGSGLGLDGQLVVDRQPVVHHDQPDRERPGARPPRRHPRDQPGRARSPTAAWPSPTPAATSRSATTPTNNSRPRSRTPTTPVGIAANGGNATNTSDGKATINTGNASATGNKSEHHRSSSRPPAPPGGALGGLRDHRPGRLRHSEHRRQRPPTPARNARRRQRRRPTAPPSSQAIGDPVAPTLEVGRRARTTARPQHFDGTARRSAPGDATAVGNDSKTSVTPNANADITGAGGGAITQGSLRAQPRHRPRQQRRQPRPGQQLGQHRLDVTQ